MRSACRRLERVKAALQPDTLEILNPRPEMHAARETPQTWAAYEAAMRARIADARAAGHRVIVLRPLLNNEATK